MAASFWDIAHGCCSDPEEDNQVFSRPTVAAHPSDFTGLIVARSRVSAIDRYLPFIRYRK
jgi:hypothetical protein